jgi:hypothetical protein
MVGRTTAEETRQFADAQLAALRESGLRRLLVSVRSSRPVFKVQGWNLSAVLDEMAGMEGLRVALVADTKELALSHQYVELLARQRGLAFKACGDEHAGVEWLMA